MACCRALMPGSALHSSISWTQRIELQPALPFTQPPVPDRILHLLHGSTSLLSGPALALIASSVQAAQASARYCNDTCSKAGTGHQLAIIPESWMPTCLLCGPACAASPSKR